jgi:Cys-tRNA(Pro)/Cys-tRNA(Cys) deacylase
MTPAIRKAQKAGIEFRVHEYPHDPAADSYGLEAAEKLGVDPQRVFKTLVITLAGGRAPLGVGVVPVVQQLDLKAAAAALGAKKAAMAETATAERATGYVVGGISPLGQKKRLPLLLDTSANNFETIYVSAGRRGLEIELSATDLLKLTGGIEATIAR